jgi:hypothetical protein
MSYSKKTNKLFFKKYVYKIAVLTPLASNFRGKNLTLTRLKVAVLEDKLLKNGTMSVNAGGYYSKQLANKADIQLAKQLVNVLDTFQDFGLRVEYNTLGLYSNDPMFVQAIENIIGISIEEVARPETDEIRDFLLSKPKAIIRKEYTHKYKVTVKPLYSEADNFVGWAEKLPKIKVASNRYTYGGHFYVADEKTLSLCHIFLSDKISKIEELVTASEI